MIGLFKGQYRFLSNFFPVKFVHKELCYPSVEHFFQAMKTLDRRLRAEIAVAKTSGEAKHLGHSVVLREDWDDVKDGVMLYGLQKKFSQPSLREALLQTGSHELIEINFWHDNYWGNCRCPKCEGVVGKNRLGLLLMEVREACNFLRGG